jgi:hypothetical protein
MKLNFLAVATLVMTTGASQLPSPEAWAEADRATRRLDPSEFTELPRTIRTELRRRGCGIPQPFTNGHRQNVIRGSFIQAGQVDWAILCSRRLSSTILVFRNGGSDVAAELARRPDADFLQVVEPNRIGFSRALGVASVEYIREHHARYGGPEPPALTHAGINDGFVEKASVVWYWHLGKWLELTGAN